MAASANATIRQAWAQAILDAVGSNGFVRSYNGSIGATGVAAVTGANTLLCQHAATGVLGVASATGIDVTETNFANTPASNLAGTPTFVDLCTSAGVCVYRIRVPADGWSFSGAVVAGQAVTMTAPMTITVGNA